jgi:hypothetical protein
LIVILMENVQTNLFQETPRIEKKTGQGYTPDKRILFDNIKHDSMPINPEIDTHLADLLSSYIKNLPDNAARKYIARLLINFIIKSADL